ncbi:phosphate signaling complex protein PhoU [Priestia flexa]|uniref:Phosphate-specific transport system accessory protein PhoU n=2 Tax=Priestia TaxID=2800373 RepID=A0A0V8JHX8_9BACI|nr:MULTISPECIES: phosphate signaling complex protein PhoU [Bacillaceae]KSU86607.1 PhoU family transcriptional regulator [Priestia veravalensis]KZB93104.1 phosphate transport system regulatory protein PhoU [Bacillus sp. VT 712]MBN8250415.1 phosphate signaling complex protein PhoU [Priestia flexa]MBN8432763.1 phosphate signaling complex protein PhoU [Priestia flexa]MCA0965251.1 phosphate signaling complex protein PhoU [Priestia flexa]
MVVREKFHADLKILREKLLEIGRLTEEALAKAIEALQTQNVDLALEIIDGDTEIDQLEEEINDLAILLLAKQQPVATDLRRVIVAIKIASDVERMADFAVNIAKSAIRIGKEDLIKPLEHVKKMHAISIEMLSLSLKAYHEEDLTLAKKVAEMDDEVDELYGITIKELLNLAKEKQEAMNQITQLLFIARYLERMADHTTNVAESVFYLVKGKRYDLNE